MIAASLWLAGLEQFGHPRQTSVMSRVLALSVEIRARMFAGLDFGPTVDRQNPSTDSM